MALCKKMKFAVLTAVSLAVSAAIPQVRADQAVEFEQEVLENGLQVIYAPMPQSPVVHVRVLYHVGSRNERPDRRGFAHMFEHMMFRGSAHVAPEEHMKLISQVGGSSNAFTSFDQTVYINTVPANQVELPLYLEADRMASFKVSDDIYRTERKVVGEEAHMRANQPFGRIGEEFYKLSFQTHSYRWLPIGDMRHLQAASAAELQQFFNTYYVPNNAILVIAGNIDVAATKASVKRSFGWIPRGADVVANIPQEQAQSAPRRAEIAQDVPLTAVQIGWHVPGYQSQDRTELSLLSTILGGGRSSRLQRLLVSGSQPRCARLSMQAGQNEDPTMLMVTGLVLKGGNAAEVESEIARAVAEIAEKGVTEAELAKAKTLHRISFIQGRETAEQVATVLGTEALFGHDANRVNTILARLDTVTPESIQRVAKKYLVPENSVTLVVKPGKTATEESESQSAAAEKHVTAEPRAVTFPAAWPEKPPIAGTLQKAKFALGSEAKVNGVRVIALEDHRLPIVSWTLTIRGGSDSEPAGKQGLGAMTAALLRRGAGDFTYAGLNEELESRGIQLEVSDSGDSTRISGSSTVDQTEYALARAADVLHRPKFSTAEFARLKTQMVNQLRVSLEDPKDTATRDLAFAMYGDTPLGRSASLQTINSVRLDDVRSFYSSVYRPEGAYLIFAGDITLERATALAKVLLDGWQAGAPPVADYTLGAKSAGNRVILVDLPDAKQSTIRMAAPAYTNKSDQKYAGSIGGQILSRGIFSRLGKYVRAEKGLAYTVTGSFSPGRRVGAFNAGTETSVDSTAAAIAAMYKVFAEMADAPITAEELTEAQRRLVGSMVLGVQTTSQQAGLRSAGILNEYPEDYYEKYADHIGQVTPEQVRDVMKQYVRPDAMTIVVVGPAAKLKDPLAAFGRVEVLPMPSKRGDSASSE